MNDNGVIEKASDFKDTKSDQWRRWNIEFDAAGKAIEKFHKQGNRSVGKYLNDRKEDSGEDCFRLNLFHSNINKVQSLMFGKLPEITFGRANLDQNDDVARVAGMIYERMLNQDIGTPNDQYSESLKRNLQDRLLAGLGVSRVRYTFDEEEVQVPPVMNELGGEVQAGYIETQVTNELAPVDYVHWRDFIWSPARTWPEVPWEAFRTLLTRDELIARFGEDVGKQIPLTKGGISKEEEVELGDSAAQDAYQKAEIWEIWNKKEKKVHWWCKGYQYMLDTREDPLGLTGFYPNPEPLVSNVTTTAFMPIPDFVMAQDMYNEIDHLESRISIITDAVKVVGVYDSSCEGVKRVMSEGSENELIGVDNWAMFAEKGGLQGTIDWLPIEEIANVLAKLVARRDDVKALLDEIIGTTDLMRGSQAGGAATATQSALQARFQSVKIQAMQDDFAIYATDLIRLRAEIVRNHFQPKSIAMQSNIMVTPDAQLAEQAISAIKNDPTLIWRIEVKPESVAMVDYAQLKEERISFITALATFMQSAAPLIEMMPNSLPIILEAMKWVMAGFKGSQDIEGVLDQAITQVKQSEQEGGEQQEPSPEQIKAQFEQQKMQFEAQEKDKERQFEIQKWQYEDAQKEKEHKYRLIEIQANNQADLRQESAQAQLNIAESHDETEQIIIRETAKAKLAPKSQSNGN